MSADQIALRIQNLAKSYKLYNSPRDNMVEALTGRKKHAEKRVLEDINLELGRGESLGILGRNGAGKSTLLKMIAGTLQPSAGTIDINGRVTAILELGSGFDPMVSGRENIMMGGLCLGMSRAEVQAKTDRIIAFSELEEAIDQPFRTFSSGMQARLTFATAIHTDPDILIVDEALAVGDVRFQVKCFSRLKDIQASGATILLVTHETNAMVRLCSRGLILEDGKVFTDGPSEEVARAYTQLIFSGKDALPKSEAAQGETAEADPSDGTRYGDRSVEILEADVLDADGAPCTNFKPWDPITFRMRLRFNVDHAGIVFGTGVRDRSANILWSTSSMLQTGKPISGRKGDELEARFAGTLPLAGGSYFVFFSLADHEDSVMLDFRENAIHLNVEENKTTTQISVVEFGTEYTCEALPNEKD